MTRDDLAARATGVGVELGVAAGAYSETLLERSGLSLLYSIDRWADHHDEAEMHAAEQRLSRFGSRSRIIRSTFADALSLFPDGWFDFIYIDGYAHTGQDNGKTLADWWTKLKRGGMFAGHDYCPQYQPTIDAVDRFIAAHGLCLHITDEADYPSWWCVKP